MDILIKNGIIVTMDKERRVLKNFSMAIDGGRITEIGREIKGDADFVLDAGNKIVLPGLINSHTHLAMTLFRGIADDLVLKKWLTEVIWPIEGKLEAGHVYAGSLLGCLEMISTGTTCFNDMYFYMDEVARSVKEAGIRAVLSYPIISFGDNAEAEKLLKEADQGVEKYGKEKLIKVFFGPHAPYTCPRELLLKVKELAEKRKTGVHIHVSETKEEVENSRRDLGMPPFEYLDSIGFLDSNVVAAHAVWVSREEMRILREKKVKIAHNPVCNMKLASGIAKVPEFLKRGITVALGTDGAASNNTLDMFETMKVCALLHKISTMNPIAMPAYKVLELATINGARALGMDREIGSLEVGKKADVILVDYLKPNLTPMNNPVSHLVYSARGCDVDTVIVDGRIIMENGAIRTLDKKEVLSFAQEQALDLLIKAGKRELVS
jgi:5-methylthioadenosine/S-adenosylhomocysteine deaminase